MLYWRYRTLVLTTSSRTYVSRQTHRAWAREHNLKNIDLEIPRDQLVVITGLSGSGKSSLAFDTIYAEGQRRYVESLSAYARQFLGLMEKPDVDQIEGLSPAISIDQRGASRNPRSTVGTITEIYDYMRLLYARIGVPHCHKCGRQISAQTVQQMVDSMLEYPEGSRLLILAPLVMDRKGEHKAVFEDVRKAGFVRVRVDGETFEAENPPDLDRYKNHTIEAVVDRLVVRRQESGDRGQEAGDGADELRARLADSVETALRLGGGVVFVSDITEAEQPKDRLFSERFACPVCGISLPEIEPRTFSFNSPHGACPTCTGLGSQMEFDADLIVPDKSKSLTDGAVRPWDRDTRPSTIPCWSRSASTTTSRSTCRSASSANTRWTSSCTAAKRATRSLSIMSIMRVTTAASRPTMRG